MVNLYLYGSMASNEIKDLKYTEIICGNNPPIWDSFDYFFEWTIYFPVNSIDDIFTCKYLDMGYFVLDFFPGHFYPGVLLTIFPPVVHF